MPTTFQHLLEQYGMIKKEQRMFYPKNFNLSEGFVKALREEIALHEKQGLEKKKFLRKLTRSLPFHAE